MVCGPPASIFRATIWERLIKIGTGVIEHSAHPHPTADELPGRRVVPRRLSNT
jgi:hypothetical protein